MWKSAVLAVALLSMACSDDPNEPAHPNAKGRFVGEWVFTITIDGGGGIEPVSCDGYISITHQSDAAVSGDAVLEAPQCENVPPSLVTGTLRPNGEVALRVAEIEALFLSFDCTGNMEFEGDVFGDDIILTTGPITCLADTSTSTVIEFTGRR